MELLIYAILAALKQNISLSDIHDQMHKAGTSEDNIFLAFKAAENLHTAIKIQEANPYKISFKRSS